MVDTTIFNKYNFLEIKSDNISEIFDFCNKYDFIIVNTNINITSNQKPFCSILLNARDNFRQYFCSKKYFLCNNKIFSFDVIYIGNHFYGFTCYNKKYIFKYEEGNVKKSEVENEIKILSDKTLQNYNFIKKQQIIYYERTNNYSLLLRKTIKGSILSKKILQSIELRLRAKILLILLEQLSVLELHKYLYCDLKLKNILFDNINNDINIIDIGSYLNFDYLVNKKFLNNNNLLICLLTIIYNFFNTRTEIIHNTSVNLNFLKDTFNYDINTRYFIKRFFIFIENNYNKITYTMIYNFFKQNEMIGNNVLDVKNIFINKYRYKND